MGPPLAPVISTAAFSRQSSGNLAAMLRDQIDALKPGASIPDCPLSSHQRWLSSLARVKESENSG
jgi:hypothetical protein